MWGYLMKTSKNKIIKGGKTNNGGEKCQLIKEILLSRYLVWFFG